MRLLICLVVMLLLPVYGCSLNPALFDLELPPQPPNTSITRAPVAPEEYVTPEWITSVGGLLGTAFLVIGHRYWYHRGRKGKGNGTG